MTDWYHSENWQDAWAPMVAAVGEDFGGAPVEAAEIVEPSAIRRYCEPLELDCPLHHDEAAARASGYRGLVAPWSGIAQTWNDPGLWKPGMRTRYRTADKDAMIARDTATDGRPWPAPPISAGMATDIEMEFHEPVCVGDHLTTRGRKLLYCTPKETSVGRGSFLMTERQIVNQRDQMVATWKQGLYMYVPHPKRDGQQAAPAAASSDAPAAQAAEPPENPPADWKRQRTFEEVQEGDSVPTLAFPLTIFRLVVEAGGNRDFAQIHHNSTVAKAQGAPEQYANNVFIQGMWERTIREYIGVAGRIKRLGPFRIRIFNPAGETVLTKGTVKRKWTEGGEHLLELEMWCEHSKGVSVGPGPVIVTLPA